MQNMNNTDRIAQHLQGIKLQDMTVEDIKLAQKQQTFEAEMLNRLSGVGIACYSCPDSKMSKITAEFTILSTHKTVQSVWRRRIECYLRSSLLSRRLKRLSRFSIAPHSLFLLRFHCNDDHCCNFQWVLCTICRYFVVGIIDTVAHHTHTYKALSDPTYRLLSSQTHHTLWL